MCVIIHRKPGIDIPFAKLESACHVNADGMGLIAIDRGKLELRKFFEPKGNKPETLAKFLEDAKDLHVYAHLRFRTKGATDKDNVHPFGVLTSKKHGVDLQFMHNGTLSDFGTKTECDSKQFAKTILRPLAERFLKSMEPNDLLHDTVFCSILDSYAGNNSVFLLTDNLGNHRIINYDNGKEFDGWWASNDYSFNRYHRSKDDGINYGYGRSTRWERDDNWVGGSPQTEKKTTVISLPSVPAGDTGRPFDDEIPFNTAKEEAGEVITSKVISPTTPQRERFTDRAELRNLSDVCQLSSEHIKDLIDEYPEEAYMLIRDLLKELYDRDMEADDHADFAEELRSVA